MQNSWLAAVLLGIVLFLPATGVTGNLSLIEKRLEELDKLNKEAVKEAGPIPQFGSVDIKAKVMPGGNILKPASESLAGKFVFGKKTILTVDEISPYTVQITASQSKEGCFKVANMLRRAGYPAFTGSLLLKDKGIWYRIYVGSYSQMEDAEGMKNTLAKDQISDGFIRSMPYAIQVGNAGSADSLKPLREKIFDIKYLPYTSNVRNAETQAGYMRLLVGAFENREDAATLLAEIRQAGLEARIVNR